MKFLMYIDTSDNMSTIRLDLVARIYHDDIEWARIERVCGGIIQTHSKVSDLIENITEL